MGEWVTCDDLPEDGEEVFVWVDGHRGAAWSNSYALVAYRWNGEWMQWSRPDPVIGVTHWKRIEKPTDETVKVGSIVQIPPEHGKDFAGCLMIVTKAKSWGVQGCIPAVGGGVYPLRVENGKFVDTGGKAEWTPE